MAPAQVPHTGLDEANFLNSSVKSCFSIKIPIVVDSPPGIIKPSKFLI